jgi:hypothetical protein
LITEQIEGLGRKLEAHVDKQFEAQRERSEEQVATLAQQMDELLTSLPTMWNPDGGLSCLVRWLGTAVAHTFFPAGIQKIRRKGQQEAAAVNNENAQAAAANDANRAVGGTLPEV